MIPAIWRTETMENTETNMKRKLIIAALIIITPILCVGLLRMIVVMLGKG